MRTLLKTSVTAGVIAAVLALSSCSPQPIDTTTFEEGLSQLDGVNGATVEVQHPGLPTNTKVVVWLFVDVTDVASVTETVRDVAEVVQANGAVNEHQVDLAVLKGEPEDYPNRGDVTSGTAKVMHRVAEELGLPESAAEFLTLEPRSVRMIVDSSR